MSRNKNRVAVFIGILISRISGFFRDLTIANYFGANKLTDAFLLAFTIPNLFRSFLAEGNLSAAFIPVFNSELKEGKEKSILLCKNVSAFLFYVSLILTVLGICFSTEVSQLLGYGFKNPETKIIAGKYLKIMFPLIIFLSIAAVCMGVLNSFNKFFITSIAPAAINISMIIAAIFFSSKFGNLLEKKIFALCLGVLFGSILNFIFLAVPYLKLGYKFSLRINFKSKSFVKTIKLMLPGIPGQAINQLNFIANRLIASFLITGSITYLFYANRLYQFPLALFGIAVSIVLLPSASKAAAKNAPEKLIELYYESLKFMLFFIIPITFFILIFSKDIIILLFQRGKFDYNAVINTSIALQCYMLGLISYAGSNITTQIFYSLKDTVTPVKLSAINMGINFILNLCVLYFKDYKYAFAGLALSNAFASYIYFGLLIIFLKKKIKNLHFRKNIVLYVLKIFFISLIGIFLAYYVKNIIHNFSLNYRILDSFFKVFLPCVLFFVLYFLATLFFKVDISLKMCYTLVKILKKLKRTEL